MRSRTGGKRKKGKNEIPIPTLRICFTKSDELFVFQCPAEIRRLMWKALKPWGDMRVETWELDLTPEEARNWKKLHVVFE